MPASRDPLLNVIGDRRLVIAATAWGGAGVVVAAWPLLASVRPSAAAQARSDPVEADISALAPGQLMTVPLRAQPVWLMRRTPEMVKALHAVNGQLAAIGIGTHLGCSPTLRLDNPAINAGIQRARRLPLLVPRIPLRLGGTSCTKRSRADQPACPAIHDRRHERGAHPLTRRQSPVQRA